MATAKSTQSKPPQAPSRTRSTSTSKQSAGHHPNHPNKPAPHQSSVTPEVVVAPSDPLTDQLQEEQDELQQPGRVAKGLGEQIDNDPGYSKDQLAHMKEYWGEGERDEPGK